MMIPVCPEFWGQFSCPQDRDLERALMNIFSKETGYTLVGAKPMSNVECFWLRRFPPDTKRRLITYLETVFKKSKTYILNISLLSPTSIGITLVHKEMFRQTVLKEPYLRKFVKMRYGTLENLFRKLKQARPSKCFNGDDRALGIAFGYGGGNARHVGRKTLLAFYLKKIPRVFFTRLKTQLHPFSITYAKPWGTLPWAWPVLLPTKDPHFGSFEAEWQWFEQEQSVPLPSFKVPYMFLLPTFFARKGKETQQLLSRYSNARDVLSKIYYEKTFTVGIAEWAKTH